MIAVRVRFLDRVDLAGAVAPRVSERDREGAIRRSERRVERDRLLQNGNRLVEILLDVHQPLRLGELLERGERRVGDLRELRRRLCFSDSPIFPRN